MFRIRHLLAAAATMVAAQSGFAGLVGKQLSATYRLPNLATVYDAASWVPASFTVGAGVETTGHVEDVTFLSVDFAESQLVEALDTLLGSPTWNAATRSSPSTGKT